MKTPSDSPDSTELLARRRRLTIDYDLYTRVAKDMPPIAANSLARATIHCAYTIRRQFLPHYLHAAPRWRVLLRGISKHRVLPDFGVVGAPKSGTTDLAATLMSHPNILGPLVKEFDSANPLDWRKFYPTRAAVQRHMQRNGMCLSPFVGPYLHFLDIANIYSDLMPRAKIIINLRDPPDLVFSHWKWLVLHTKTDVLTKNPFLGNFSAFVETALDIFPGYSSPFWGALHSGIYWHSVTHWLSCFGEENIRVFDISEYFKNRTSYMNRVARFIGLPCVEVPQGVPVANKNPLAIPQPTSETTAKLREFFEPYNRRLWSVLGTRYPW